MDKGNICPKRIIGCDPSFAHFGLTIIDRMEQSIKTYDIQSTLGKQDFLNVCIKSKQQVDNVVNTIKSEIIFESLDNVIGMENALPHAFNATSLTALDVQLFYAFNPIRTALFNPTYLNYIMGKHTKKDSINLAMALISIFEKHGYKHTIQAEKKLTDGEAESFIYACRMLCRTQPEDEITKDIIELQPLFADEKEKYIDEFIY